MRRTRRTTAGRDRGQTAQDFALGIGFFVVAVAFVFAFIPSMQLIMRSNVGILSRDMNERGQTSFDFLVGMSVFLVTLAIVLTFVPTMFQPFDTDTGPNMVVADRSAALLAEDLLAENVDSPGTLNATCTTEFFDEGVDVADCRFDQDASDLNAALALDGHSSVNVTVESGGSILSVDGQALQAGKSPPGTADVVVGKRGVLVDGEHGVLIVRVW